MPPRRSTTRRTAASTRQQSTLSFHGKSNKITKNTSPRSAKSGKKPDPSLLTEDQISQVPLESSVSPDREEEVEEDQAATTTTTTTTTTKPLHKASEPAAAPAVEDPLSTPSEPTTISSVLGGIAQPGPLGALTSDTKSGWVSDEESTARKISETQIKRYWRAKESARLAPRVHQEGLDVHEKVLREWDVSGEYGPCIGIARLKRWKRANVLGLKPPIEVLAVLLREMDGERKGKVQRAHVDELMSSRFVEA